MSDLKVAHPSSQLNPFAVEDPYPVYAQLRELGPIVWLESLGVWGVFHDALVRLAAQDWKVFSNAGGSGIQNFYREKPWREPSMLIDADPPEHSRPRTILTRLLSPGALIKLKLGIQTEAQRLVDWVVEMGSFDAVEDFAKPFLLKVFPDAIGLPSEGRDNIILYNYWVRKARTTRVATWTKEEVAESDRVVAWITAVCSRESLAPNGFGAEIYAAVDSGQINEREGNLLVRSFLSAGTETTITGLSHTLYYLAADPEQWRVVRDNPAKARTAFEEMLRLDPPAQFLGRTTKMPVVFQDVQLGQYEKVLLFVASANRDPQRWSDPDRFWVERNPAGHLGLGIGVHSCVGQMLARLEGEILLGTFARAVESIEISGTPVRNAFRPQGFASLPLTVRRKSV
jgi:cytochrome P450